MRSELEGRPLLGIVAALIIGISTVAHPLNLLAAIVVLLVWRALPTRVAVAAALLLGVLVAPQPAKPLESGMYLDQVLSIDTIPRIYPDKLSFEAVVSGHRLLVFVPGKPEVSFGAKVRVRGTAKPLPDSIARYFAIRGVEGTLFGDDCAVVAPSPPVFAAADAWRRSFDTFAHATMPHNLANIASALCFNLDRLLDDAFEEKLQITGTIHIVSVSGLHIVVLALALTWSLSRLPVPRWLQLTVAIVVLSFYALATGLNPPTVRAVLMALMALAAYSFKREPDWLSALAATAILYLLWKPFAVYDIGFQLSFLTVAALCLFLVPDREPAKTPVREWIDLTKEAGMASLIATLASAPLVAFHFGRVSIVGVFANVLIAAAVPVIIVICFLAHLISVAAMPVAKALMEWVVTPLIGYLHGVLEWFAAPSWASISLPGYSGYVLVPLYGAMILLWRVRVRRA
jgi:competence protein ComEC